MELVQGACPEFNVGAFLAGEMTPVFSVRHSEILGWITCWMVWSVGALTLPRETDGGIVNPCDSEFSGFVFKIQANMDPQHRDRVAFLRICSGVYEQGMKMQHVRIGKEVRIADALTFMAGDRARVERAVAGDIIGLHNHGTIQIGDSFTSGSDFKFTGIPNFAPELFRRIRLRDPLKIKQLQKGLIQLSEEGLSGLSSVEEQ